MGIASNGSYGIPEGLICGVPVTCSVGDYHGVEGLPIDDFARSMIDRTVAELKEELAAVETMN
jgi:malate dehydrogenase